MTTSYAERPTHIRFGVLFFLCTLAILLYIDRVCIGQAASHIQKEFGISKTQMSFAFMAFSLAYSLFELPAGWWGDRYGSRGVITRVAVFWSIFTAMTGAATGLYSLILIRFLFGAGEAGALPNAARVVTRWFPEQTRGRVRGAINFSSLLGATIAPVLATHLIGSVGWRGMFMVFGVLGIAWAILFYWRFRDDPATHPDVNAAELQWIGPVEIPVQGDATHRIPWGVVFTSANIWLLGLIMTVCGTLFYFLFQWFPSYLKEARGLSDIDAGWRTSVVMAGGALGCLTGGWVSDLVLKFMRNRAWGRSLSGAGALILSGLAACAVRFLESSDAIMVCSAVSLFFMQISLPTWWSVVAEISGRHGGAMWGLMNSMASLGLIGLNLVVGMVVDHRQRAGMSLRESWNPVFDIVAAGLFLGGICWMIVNTNRALIASPEGGV
jgi:sugar phosphate permease